MEYIKEILILLFISVLGMLFCAYKANNSKEITDVIRYLVIMIILCTISSTLTITLINIYLTNESKGYNLQYNSNGIINSDTIHETVSETNKGGKQNLSKSK